LLKRSVLIDIFNSVFMYYAFCFYNSLFELQRLKYAFMPRKFIVR